MLQGDPNKRLSAQQCLSDRLFLEMQFASSYVGGWRVREPTFNAKGEFADTKFNITKKFPPKARAPLPSFCDGAVTKAIYDPGVGMGVALEAQASKRCRTARASRARRPITPKPVAFGLVFDDPHGNARW